MTETDALAAALRHAGRQLGRGMALCLLLTLFVNTAVLVVPLYDMQLYDRVIQSRNLDTVLFLSLACLVGLVLYGLVDMLRAAALLAIADSIAACLHKPLLEHAIGRGLGGEASAGAEAIYDITVLCQFLGSGAVCVPLEVICGTILLTVLFLLHPAYGFLGLFGASVLVLLNLLTDVLTRKSLTAATQQRQRVAGELVERLRNAELTEGLGLLPAIGRHWSRQQDAALAGLHHAHERAHLLALLAKLVKMLLQAGVMVLGAVMILAHATTPGSLMGANLLLNKLLGPFDALVGSWRQWSLALAAWQRIQALRDRPAELSGMAAAPADDAQPGLVLTGLGFRAPANGRVLLSGITLYLPPGRMLGVVGPNGAGKTTLLRLLAGLLSPSEGSIRLDGLSPDALDRRQIGYLPQSVGLLDGTVGDNIARFAEDADPIEAARLAGVHELIGRLPRGYETALRPDSGSVSVGHLARIALARALFGAPRLLVLDEPDASLDGEGEAALRAALLAARAQGGIIVLTTHRPGLLAATDMLLELREGGIATLRPGA